MDLTKAQAEVLSTFKLLGPIDDAALAAYVHHMSDVPMSSSGIRTRRAELVTKGALRVVGEHRLKSGRTASIHGLTTAGQVALRGLRKSRKVAKAVA